MKMHERGDRFIISFRTRAVSINGTETPMKLTLGMPQRMGQIIAGVHAQCARPDVKESLEGLEATETLLVQVLFSKWLKDNFADWEQKILEQDVPATIKNYRFNGLKILRKTMKKMLAAISNECERKMGARPRHSRKSRSLIAYH